jgi:2-polyprenyl-3-methyl-5-hydroxy-6-metoxy-1,4-benzoquinol methylase
MIVEIESNIQSSRAQQVDAYYTRKDPEYLAKYGLAGRVHIHAGHYSEIENPELFQPNWIRPELGSEYLRALVCEGQDRTISRIVGEVERWGKLERVLDCGAGLGGTSWVLAERHNSLVDALTVSRHQFEYLLSKSQEIGLSQRVTPILADVFGNGWSDGAKYNAIIGIDAFCQMGDYELLVKRLAAMQDPGGVIGISDYFSTEDGQDVAESFNRYWTSRVDTIESMLNALKLSGYDLTSLTETSAEQLPYWDLSIAISRLELPGWTTKRRWASRQFHVKMRQALSTGRMNYFQLVAVKA